MEAASVVPALTVHGESQKRVPRVAVHEVRAFGAVNDDAYNCGTPESGSEKPWSSSTTKQTHLQYIDGTCKRSISTCDTEASMMSPSCASFSPYQARSECEQHHDNDEELPPNKSKQLALEAHFEEVSHHDMEVSGRSTQEMVIEAMTSAAVPFKEYGHSEIQPHTSSIEPVSPQHSGVDFRIELFEHMPQHDNEAFYQDDEPSSEPWRLQDQENEPSQRDGHAHLDENQVFEEIVMNHDEENAPSQRDGHAHVDENRVFREIIMNHDADESEVWDSDYETEGLAELQEQRIRENFGHMFDFEFYYDP